MSRDGSAEEHAGHSHAQISADTDSRRLGIALGLIVAFMAAEVIALSAHVLVHPGDDCHHIRAELEQLLHERFGIEHTTLQVDHNRAGELLTISRPARLPGTSGNS